MTFGGPYAGLTGNIERGERSMKEVDLKVTIDEANLIMEGLGQLPFARVYTLVAKLQDQAARQLNGGTDEEKGAVVQHPGAPLHEQAHGQ